MVYDDILKMSEILKKNDFRLEFKTNFYIKYFPSIENCEDWILVVPKGIVTEEILRDVKWLREEEYTSKVITFNPKDKSALYTAVPDFMEMSLSFDVPPISTAIFSLIRFFLI